MAATNNGTRRMPPWRVLCWGAAEIMLLLPLLADALFRKSAG